MSNARRRRTDAMVRLCRGLGIDAELIRQSKHPVYRLTNRHGATMQYATSATASDIRAAKNRRRDLERFSEERP